jgi:hypothetical protein
MDSARFDGCFDNELGTALCDRLKVTARLQERLASVITAKYGLMPTVDASALDEIDRAIVLLPAPSLTGVARRSGVIYWASAIANVILAPQVDALHRQIGEELCNFGLAHRDLAGPEAALESFDDVAERIVTDGWRCFAAWCRSLPTGLGARVLIKLPATAALDAVPAPPFVEIGPAIVRRAAGGDGTQA